jgi:hypothetical protein
MSKLQLWDGYDPKILTVPDGTTYTPAYVGD